jgi:hypothetical protein
MAAVTAVAIAAMAMQVIGGYMSGRAKKKAAKRQAEMMAAQRKEMLRRAKINAQMEINRGLKMEGRATVSFAKGGVAGRSTDIARQDILDTSVANAQRIIDEAKFGSLMSEMSARNVIKTGEAAATAGMFGGASSAMQTGAKYDWGSQDQKSSGGDGEG